MPNSDLFIYYQNVRGLRTKTLDFFASVVDCTYDIICITESWLSSDVFDNELFPDFYSVFRADRKFDILNKNRGGGAILALQSKYFSQLINVDRIVSDCPQIDIVGCLIKFNHVQFIIYVLYIPPDISFTDFETFLSLFEEINVSYNLNIIIVGDFNSPHFTDDTVNDSKTRALLHFSHFLGLEQVNSVRNSRLRLLDLIFTNIEDITISRDESPLVSEDNDHPSIQLVLPYSAERINNLNANGDLKFNFRRADFVGLYNAFTNVDWSFMYHFTDVAMACTAFYNKVYCLFNQFIPKTAAVTSTYPIWFTRDHINDIKRKNYYRLRYRKTKSVHDLNKFRELRKKVKINTKILFNNYISSVEVSVMTTPQQFWKFVRSRKNDSGIPNAMINSVGDPLEDPLSIVDGFREFFQSVFLPTAPLVSDMIDTRSNASCISIKTISEPQVLQELRNLKTNFTMGSDGIPTFILKDCANILTGPLCYLFNLSICTSKFPDIWKSTKLYPVFKKGDRHCIENYRPIAIINNIAKVFEKCLYKSIYPQIQSLISTDQHGFMAKRSTVTNLVAITQYLSNNLDNNKQVDVIYTDMAKAFDRIDHSILLCKLDRIGFSAPLVSLFDSYLSKRKHYVAYKGHFSDQFSPSSGVPQGTNLGPLLFLIFINDLPARLDCHKLLFADDLKIFSTIEATDDCAALQHQIDGIHEWCVSNRLSMNVSKCTVLTFSRKANPIVFDYCYDGSVLGRTSSMRDLGVTFDSRLSFTEHANAVTLSALRMLGFIIRTTRNFNSIQAILALYFSYVRSKLEYASIVWSPVYKFLICQLERVQRRCLKYIYYRVNRVYPVQGFSHQLLLNMFSVDSLDLRRKRADMRFLYNLLNNGLDAPGLLENIHIMVPRSASRTFYLFYCLKPRTNIMIKSPFYRICTYFNQLSDISIDLHHSTLTEILNKCTSNFHMI